MSIEIANTNRAILWDLADKLYQELNHELPFGLFRKVLDENDLKYVKNWQEKKEFSSTEIYGYTISPLETENFTEEDSNSYLLDNFLREYRNKLQQKLLLYLPKIADIATNMEELREWLSKRKPFTEDVFVILCSYKKFEELMLNTSPRIYSNNDFYSLSEQGIVFSKEMGKNNILIEKYYDMALLPLVLPKKLEDKYFIINTTKNYIEIQRKLTITKLPIDMTEINDHRYSIAFGFEFKQE